MISEEEHPKMRTIGSICKAALQVLCVVIAVAVAGSFPLHTVATSQIELGTISSTFAIVGAGTAMFAAGIVVASCRMKAANAGLASSFDTNYEQNVTFYLTVVLGGIFALMLAVTGATYFLATDLTTEQFMFGALAANLAYLLTVIRSWTACTKQETSRTGRRDRLHAIAS